MPRRDAGSLIRHPLSRLLVSPGASARIKDGYERLMKVHGRWIIAVLLLAAAAFVGHNAFEHLPRS